MTEQELLRIAEQVEEWYDGRGALVNEPEEAALTFANYIGGLLMHIDRLVNYTGQVEEELRMRSPQVTP